MNRTETMDVKLLLVVKDQKRERHYFDVLNEHGATCRAVSSLPDAVTTASEEPHCGVLVDMQLMLKIPSAQRMDVEDLLNCLPSATLNIHGPSGDIRILPRGVKASGCTSVEHFIKQCACSGPKIFFHRKRDPIHYNVTLDISPEFTSPYKTVCIDYSAGGCFLFCVREDFTVGRTVWITMPDAVSESPRKAVVCWIRVWGTTQSIPGIGVRFVDVSD